MSAGRWKLTRGGTKRIAREMLEGYEPRPPWWVRLIAWLSPEYLKRWEARAWKAHKDRVKHARKVTAHQLYKRGEIKKRRYRFINTEEK